MRIDGTWSLCDDGVVRPLIVGEVMTSNGSWEPAEFLVDTGADRTVFSAAILAKLGSLPVLTHESLGGLGGLVKSVIIETQIRLTRENSGKVIFRGQYSAVTELEALDFSVLGRDITGLFAVIVDKPRDVVCLLGQHHRYQIEVG